MTCHHATTTTIAWMYGEGSDEHDLHVTNCADCQAVLETHSDVMSTVGPVLDQLAPEQAPQMPSALELPPPVQPSANRPWALAIAGLVVAAAVALFALTPWFMATPAESLAEHEVPALPAPPELPPVHQAPVIDTPESTMMVASDDLPDAPDELGQDLNDIFDELDAFEQEMLTL